MRAIKFSLLAVAAMAAVSCAKEITPETNETPEVNPNLVEITLTSTGESDEDTKAVFSGYPKIAWEGNEEIRRIWFILKMIGKECRMVFDKCDCRFGRVLYLRKTDDHVNPLPGWASIETIAPSCAR